MREEVQNWREQAQADVDTAEFLFEGKKYKEASFFAQQAAEKGLKAALIHKTGKLIKIHDLVKLGQLVDISSSLRNDCEKLTIVYVDSRYPDTGSEKYSREEAKLDIERARRILQWAEKNT